MTVTPEASRAARGILKWSMRDLAKRAGVSWTTIARLEAGAVDLRDATAVKIRAAFKAERVELILTENRTGAVIARSKKRDVGAPEGS